MRESLPRVQSSSSCYNSSRGLGQPPAVLAAHASLWRSYQKMPSGKSCAYCGQVCPLTKEHLWPAALHRRLLAANGEDESLFWMRRIKKEIAGELQVGDVCAECNNKTLSTLDTYICDLFDRYFVRLPNRFDEVMFCFDYHMLKRWLLKTCFNSARIHQARDAFAFKPLLPYIRGQSTQAGKSVQLFLSLQYSEEIPSNIAASADGLALPSKIFPDINRVGHIFFRVPGTGQKLLRAVHLRAYTFFLAFFDPEATNSSRNHFSSEFLERMSCTIKLRPSKSQISILCNGIGAWQSFEDSRRTEFVFSQEIL